MEIAETQVVGRARKYRSYSMKDRLQAVSMSESGMGSVCIGREMGIDSSLIRGWIRRYKKEGINGLKPKSHRSISGCFSMSLPELVEGGCEADTVFDTRKGFIHFVDNPALVRSMVNTLSAYGLPMEDITVGDDARQFARSMAAGETLVLNSLFDLSSDFAKMLCIIEELLRAGITIVSISDKSLEIKPGDTDSLGLVSILKNYLSLSLEGMRQIGDDAVGQLGYQATQSIPLTPRSKKEKCFLAALDLYQKGHTMASAARIAGCSYTSFRYWLQNKVMQDNATGGMREIPDQR